MKKKILIAVGVLILIFGILYLVKPALDDYYFVKSKKDSYFVKSENDNYFVKSEEQAALEKLNQMYPDDQFKLVNKLTDNFDMGKDLGDEFTYTTKKYPGCEAYVDFDLKGNVQNIRYTHCIYYEEANHMFDYVLEKQNNIDKWSVSIISSLSSDIDTTVPIRTMLLEQNSGVTLNIYLNYNIKKTEIYYLIRSIYNGLKDEQILIQIILNKQEIKGVKNYIELGRIYIDGTDLNYIGLSEDELTDEAIEEKILYDR